MYALEDITIAQAFKRTVNKAPGKLALEFRDKKVSWEEFDTVSDHFSYYFSIIGIKEGTHVAIWNFPCLEFFYAYIGLMKLGAVAIPVNIHYKQRELADALEKVDAEYLLCCKERKDMALEVFTGAVCFDEIIINNKLRKTAKTANPDVNDTANILFTSGTTSGIKGAMLTHFNIFNNGAIIAEKLRINADDKLCLCVPMFHCFGVTVGFMVSIVTGCSLYVIDDFSTINVLEAVDKHKCTILNGVPTMFLSMLHKKELDEFDLSSLKTGIIAGSPVSQKEYLEICRKLDINLFMSYGLTETSPCVSISGYDDSLEEKSDNVGFVTEHVEVKIADINTGESLGKGQNGEILVKGYNVMQGYYHLKAETEKIFDSGYLRTGDLGYIDDNNRLHIIGRIKEIIIRGGEKISPSEIENCIKECENILKVKVVGVESAVLHEEIAACIITKDGSEACAETIKEYLAQKLAYYKIPKYVFTFKEFPLSEVGKVKLNEIKKIANDLKNRNK